MPKKKEKFLTEKEILELLDNDVSDLDLSFEGKASS